MTQDSEMRSNKDMRLNEESSAQNMNNELKPGEFMLTYLQVLFLNKKLPLGYKLELKDSYMKTAEQSSSFVGHKRKKAVSWDYILSN